MGQQRQGSKATGEGEEIEHLGQMEGSLVMTLVAQDNRPIPQEEEEEEEDGTDVGPQQLKECGHASDHTPNTGQHVFMFSFYCGEKANW